MADKPNSKIKDFRKWAPPVPASAHQGKEPMAKPPKITMRDGGGRAPKPKPKAAAAPAA